jgi:hypothetical protein
MSDLAAEIEGAIRAHRLPSLERDLPQDEFVLPNYEGLSIVNLPATEAALLGLSLPDAAPPLPREVWGPFAGGVRCVLRVVVDALGYYHLQRVMAAQPDILFQRLLRRGGGLVPLTSVCPSTTTTALASLWTGQTPARHGLLGTRLFLRDLGLRAHMIYFNPVGLGPNNFLIEAGLDAANFLPVPGLAQILAGQGIETHVFINRQYVKGGLSDIFFRGVKAVHGFTPGSGADLWMMLRAFLEERVGERLFVTVYWGVVDALAHRRGPSSPAIGAELGAWAALMEREFLSSPAVRSGTVLTILADHGAQDTPPARAVRLDHHPELQARLLMKPLGEQRLSYLFARQGQVGVVRRYLREHLSHAFVVLEAAQAQELFGPGTPAPETAARWGDLILVSRRDHILYDGDEEPHMLGQHGGLSPEEMLVPYLITRLDGGARADYAIYHLFQFSGRK